MVRFKYGSLAVLLFLPAAAHSHKTNLGALAMDWHTEQIARVLSLTFGDDEEVGQVVTLDGKQCLEGNLFYIDVDDRYAFDVDETVRVEVEFYQHREAVVSELHYEKNGQGEAMVRSQVPGYKAGPRAYNATFVLERARFANRELLLTDFTIGSGNTLRSSKQAITICSISVTRSHTSVLPKAFGAITVEVSDEIGRFVPARVGIYDQTGRLPLPSEEAIAVKRLDEMVRVVNPTPGLIPWPVRNPSAFYVDGSYRAKLPVGEYELVVGKGPEYRFFRRNFKIESGQTQTLKVKLKRWDDLPAKGWYSGDNHIHYIRHDESDDRNLLLFTQAEDLHVANILQMGNIATAGWWPQYGWTPVIAIKDETYSFVPGQEDPRTTRRGHTISLHLKEPIHDPQHYLLYHKVFEKARKQGAVTGYAHAVGEGAFNARGGLALDVPFGLVDFVEVMQFGSGGSNVWFDFLNLGYKLAPSAGTDYAIDRTLPGAERSYVHVSKPFSLQSWFDALKRGESFVTNGPMLEFTVNGHGMGSALQLKSGDKLTIDAAASINPDIDYLESLELIEQGEVVKTTKAKNVGETTLRLHHEVTAQHGTWFVVRARGRLPYTPLTGLPAWNAKQESAKISFSGAVYVYVDGQSFWKPSAVPSIVQSLRQEIEKLLEPETGEGGDRGTRATALTMWDSQKVLLKQRIDQVLPIYDQLLVRANEAAQKGGVYSVGRKQQ